MKAMPVILSNGRYEKCSADEATHVTINMPGPSGRLTLPVIRSGTRAGTNSWTWNGSVDKPTLRPSVLSRGIELDDDLNDIGPYTCHSWINDGCAQFLTDSTHKLSGCTVVLLDVEQDA